MTPGSVMNHTTLASLRMTAGRKKPCAHCMEAWCIIQSLSLPQCLQNLESKMYLEEMQEDVPEFGEEEEDADVLLQDKDFDHAQQVPSNNYGGQFLPHNAKHSKYTSHTYYVINGQILRNQKWNMN